MPPTTAPQLASLFLEQAGQCALTGWDMGLSLTDPRAAVPVPVAKKPVVPSVIEDWFYTSAERRTNAEKHAREVQAWRDAGVVLVSAIAATRMRGLTFMEFLSAKPGDRPSRRELAERLKARAR